jgi:(p)ppGpp synthase/HD superfamily hydrolase
VKESSPISYNEVLPLQNIPLPPQPWLTSFLFAEALRVAALMHAAQARKGINVPYISHLIGTCSIALEHGATEAEAIAALLHDSIEDIQPAEQARSVVAHFGQEVLRIVEECSDSDTHPKPSWRPRKERYLAHLAKADRAVLLVSASDKLHNARTIVTDFRIYGPSVWDRFTPSRDESLWYYRALLTAFRTNSEHLPALVAELDRAVTEMERLAYESGARV